MTLSEFDAICHGSANSEARIPTPGEFLAFLRAQKWRVEQRGEGRAVLCGVDRHDALAVNLAKMLSREPYRTEVLALVVGEGEVKAESTYRQLAVSEVLAAADPAPAPASGTYRQLAVSENPSPPPTTYRQLAVSPEAPSSPALDEVRALAAQYRARRPGSLLPDVLEEVANGYAARGDAEMLTDAVATARRIAQEA